MGIQIKTHTLETISTRTIRDLGEALRRSSEHFDTLVAPPAGKNRTYMQKPIIEMTTALAHEFDDLRITLRVGVDTTELHKAGIPTLHAESFPEYQLYKREVESLPNVSIRPKIQPETNSVLECLAALHEVRELPSNPTLLLPRDMESICTRIRTGLRPYLNTLEVGPNNEILLVKVPLDERYASYNRSLSEAFSVVATKLFALAGPKMLQDYLEKKGFLGRVMKGLQQLKLKALPKPK